MSPRQDVSEERRSQILEAATNVFARLGFDKARMDDIVEQSGLSKGALYWYFKSKDEIITALLSGLFDRELAMARELINSDAPATDRLMQLAHGVIGELKYMTKLMPVMYEFYAVALRNKTVRKSLSGYLSTYMEVLTPIVQQGIDAGEFRATNPREAALAITSIIEGTILLWVFDPNTVKLEKHIESSVRLLLDGLKVPSKKLSK
jgi:AcrR family transcriptional regulator